MSDWYVSYQAKTNAGTEETHAVRLGEHPLLWAARTNAKADWSRGDARVVVLWYHDISGEVSELDISDLNEAFMA